MKTLKFIILGSIFLSTALNVKANDIQVSTFYQLINSHPNSGDTIEFLDNLNSDSTIGYNFYGINISFQGGNYSINGNNSFGGFVLNKESLFNLVEIINCKGQEYNRSNFAGAIYNNGGTMEIQSSAFKQNFADSGGINFAVGGAVYNLDGSSININNSLFESNFANGASSYGGAIANGYQVGSHASMSINNSIFKNNHAKGSVIEYGGAIYNNGNLDLFKTTFDGNYTQGEIGSYVYGGAIYNEGTNNISQNNFNENKAIGSNYSVVTGGSIYNSKIININNSSFIANSGTSENDSLSVGGSIYNTGDTKVENSTFSLNSVNSKDRSNSLGGAIYNSNNMEISNSKIESNTAVSGNDSNIAGGAIYNIGNTTITNSIISNNSASGNSGSDVKGGAIYNNSILTINSSTINNNSAFSENIADGGAIYNNTNGTLTIQNSILENNKISTSATIGEGGAIYNSGTINLEDSTLKDNFDKTGSLNDIYNANGTINITGKNTNNILSGIAGTGTINKSNTGTLNLGGINKNFTGNFNFENGSLNLLANSSYFNANNTYFGNNINFNMQNKDINDINFGNLTLNGTTNLFVDANLSTKNMDTINAQSINGSGTLFVKNLELEGVPEQQDITLPFANTTLKNYVRYNSTTLETPIYNYLTSYDSTNGTFNFIRQNFNPTILNSEVATQLGGYLTQLETYKNVFANLDMVMISPEKLSQNLSFQNKFADTSGKFAFSPLLIPEQKRGIWFKPYSTFENVPLKNGPTVSNVQYGTLVGGESELTKLKHNWYMLYGTYIGYNGSHQAYSGNSIYNNGGLLGLNAVFYKGKFFSAWTANVGANSAEANTNYGRDDFAMLTTGIAQKSGYNLELLEKRLIIQPSILTSYSFINTFNYTTTSGAQINTKPLNALHIEPGIKIIGNFKNYLQPYISVSMAWNLIDNAQFKANDITLTNLSVKPYVQYGLGIQKRWGERITGFLEGMIRNGGRNGIALLFGLRISI